MTRHMNGYRIGALLLTAAAFAACDKNTVQQLPVEPLLSARIKFFNFGVNAPGVNFYADATKMTAVLSTTGSEATTGVAYGAVGNGGAYSQISPGSHMLTGRIAAIIDKDTAVAVVNPAIDDSQLHYFFLNGGYKYPPKKDDAVVRGGSRSPVDTFPA